MSAIADRVYEELDTMNKQASDREMGELVVRHQRYKVLVILRDMHQARLAAWAACHGATKYMWDKYKKNETSKEEDDRLCASNFSCAKKFVQIEQSIEEMEIRLLDMEVSAQELCLADMEVAKKNHELLEYKLKMLKQAREKLKLGMRC